MTKYETLAKQLRIQIEEGIWSPGEKLPSLRKQVELSGFSLMTVMQSYQLLESQGVIVSHERSGYFVAAKIDVSKVNKNKTTAIAASESVDINDFIFDVLQSGRATSVTNFGYVYPDPTLYPKNHVNKALASILPSMPTFSALDNLPPGNHELRTIIAKRYAAQGINVKPEELVITAGALEALNLSLQSVTSPGDWVIVESPAFYGSLQALQRLNLKALSVRTDPKTGLDLAALEKALESRPVKACWLMTNHQNPTGSTMPSAKKKQLVDLLERYQVYLIEDDVYNELFFGDERPLPAKAYDTSRRIMHCSSLSKSLIAGYRIGWVAAGDMAKSIQKLQLMSTLSVSSPIQLAFVKYLQTRNYERHLRYIRKTLAQRKFATWKCMRANFPTEVTINYSDGGYFLWVELPEYLDATELYLLALKQDINIAPGKMFALNKEYDHCFRLNASFECEGRVEYAIQTLGTLIKDLITTNKSRTG